MRTQPTPLASGSDGHEYRGRELELFARAHNWKAYLSAVLSPYLGARVLEVGAGIGATTAVLCGPRQQAWLCLEPSATQRRAIDAAIADGTLPASCRSRGGTVADCRSDETFDTVLYVDVLEHIEDDAAELARAAACLAPNGRLVVLAPAHQWLFSPFDAAVGHHRRYATRTLRAAGPPGLALERLCYLDCVGMLASLGNRLALRESVPSLWQIQLWDRLMVPVSRVMDPLTGYRLGKSLLGVWRGGS